MEIQYSDEFIYLFIFLAIYFLFRVWISVKKTPFSSILIFFKRILLAIGGILYLSGCFYWLLTNLYSQESGFISWFVALDITLAHFVVTLPILYLSVFMAWDLIRIIAAIIAAILAAIIEAIAMILAKSGDIWEIIFGLIRVCVTFILTCLITFLSCKYLLIQTLDVQLLLFGAFDPGLGFHYPTTYRFSVLYAHLQSVYETLRTDQIMISILGLSVIITGLIIGASNIIKAVGDIKKEFEPRSNDKNY